MPAVRKAFQSRLFQATASVFIVFTINFGSGIIVGADRTDAVLLNFVSKFSSSFMTYNFVDILAFIGIYLLIRYVDARSERVDRSGIILSLLLSFLYVVATGIRATNDSTALFGNSFQLFATIFTFLGYFCLFYFLFEFLMIRLQMLSAKPVETEKEGWLSKHLLLYSFLIIFLFWLPWILMNYPGSFSGDATAQLNQFMFDEINSHQPVFSTFIMGMLVEAGTAVADSNFGAFLYLLLQTVLGAFVFAYSIQKLRELGTGRKGCLLALVFYAVTPIWGLFAQWYEKDLLYAELAFLHVILMTDIIRFRKFRLRDAFVLGTIGLLVSLLRNNGIYVVVPACIVLALYLSKAERHRMTGVVILTLVVYCSITHFLYPAFGIEKGSAGDALSLPFQQTARYVVYYGKEVTSKEQADIEAVLDYSALPEVYDPTCADSVKTHYSGDDAALPAYIKTWLVMGLKHPGVYFDALVNFSYGYLGPTEQNIEPDISFEYDPQTLNLGFYRIFGELPTEYFYYFVQAAVRLPFIRYLTMPGLYTWIVLAAAAALIRNRKFSGIILLIPEFLDILICIASPLCNAMRYELPVAAAAPLLIGWVCSRSIGHSV